MSTFLSPLRPGAIVRPTLSGKTAPSRRTTFAATRFSALRRAGWLLALVALAMAAGGCTMEDRVRLRAATDLGCDAAAVHVEDRGGGRYVASGCSESATYYGVQSRYGAVIGPVETPKAEIVVAPPPPQLLESPSAAGGFAFGASEDDTRRACLQAGHVYTRDAAGFAMCDGVAADVGAPARATFTYCAGKLCRVSLDVGIAPTEDPSRALVRWKTALVDKYGNPSGSHEDIPGRCSHNVTPCLLDNSGSISLYWQWASQESITLSTEVDDRARPLLNISYVAAPAMAKVVAPGL
jgi:hypothetical protein